MNYLIVRCAALPTLMACSLATGIAYADDNAKLPMKIEFFAAFDEPAEGLVKKQFVNGSDEADKQIVYLAAKPEVTGADVKEIKAEHDSAGKPLLAFEMTETGAVKMKNLAFKQLDHRITLVIDNKDVTAPKLRYLITKDFQLTGNFTEDWVNQVVAGFKRP